MNKKLIFALLTIMLVLSIATVSAFNSDDLNRRLRNCTPTKDYHAGGSTVYQISGLTGSTCIFKIEQTGASDKPNLICKVPYTMMYKMTSVNPFVIQGVKNQYCVMSLKSLNKPKKVY